MGKEEFIEEIFEMAFGDDAINKDYTYQEVLIKISEYEIKAFMYDENLQED